MQNLKLICLTIILTLSTTALAQDHKDINLQDLHAALSDLDDFDEDGWQEAYEILTDMAQSPQNINEVTFEDLQQVPLLTDTQAAAILHYRSLYGDLHSMAELSLITAIDRPRQMLIAALFYASPTKDDGRHALIPKDSVTSSSAYYYTNKEEGKGNVVFTISVPTYEREGYKDGTYRGYAVNHALRYKMHGKHYQLALTAAQDAGEPFFAGTNKKGWDFYTGYLRLKNMGIIKNLVVGHYQATIGMGLIMNNSYRLSRTSMLITPPSPATVLRGHSSRQEGNYLQGVATTLAMPGRVIGGKVDVTAFLSYRYLDATMSAATPPTVTTILTTGYHRTDSEIARRNTTQQTVAGLSLAYTAAPLRLSLNVVHVHFADSLLPSLTQKYRYYSPRGKDFTSASLAYGYTSTHVQLSGETALSSKAMAPTETGNGISLATQNNLYVKMSSNWTAFAVQRFYSYRYQSLLGNSFGDVSNVQNENGVYAGATTTALPHTSISAYVDYAYHPWYRYGHNAPSKSLDTYLLATYTRKKTIATMRLRYRNQDLNDSEGGGGMTLRTTLKYTSGRWTSMSQLQGCYQTATSDAGWLASEAMGYKHGKLALWASLAYFDTSDYSSRLYLTNRALTYGSASAMLYGNGIRVNAIGQVQIMKSVSAALRCNIVHYFDRDQISSGHQLIDSPSQTDLQMQLTWKF